MDLRDLREENLKKLTKKELSKFDEDEQKLLLTIIKEISEEGESKTLNALWYEDYEEIPVDIDTFLDDPYYIGKSGETIYPAWREQLRNIFDPKREHMVNEAIFTGAIGIGKSQIAVTAICYVLYNLLCLKNPQEYYQIAPNNPIGIVLINVSLAQSNLVAYSKLMGIIQDSPWFAEHGTAIENNSGFKYIPDKNIVIKVGSNPNHVIGMDVFCLVGDTLIETTKGSFEIQKLNGQWFNSIQYDCGRDELVASEECTVMQTGVAEELIELEFENGVVQRCTPEHLWLVHTPEGFEYKQAQNLDEYDNIVTKEEELAKWTNRRS